MEAHKTNDSAICKECLEPLDAATSIEGAHVPKEGDFTVCIKCGALSRFTEDLMLDLCTQEDLILLGNDNPEGYRQLVKAQTLIRERVDD